MTRFLWVMVFLLYGMAGHAQQITVRSGEHSDFTRVTLAPSERVNWRLRQDGKEVVVFVETATATFDISAVFDRIQRQRIVDVQADTQALRLTLGCACSVRSFEADSGLIVIDIEGARDPLSRLLDPSFANRLDSLRYQFPPGLRFGPVPDASGAAFLQPRAIGSLLHGGDNTDRFGTEMRLETDHAKPRGEHIASGRSILSRIESGVWSGRLDHQSDISIGEAQLLAGILRARSQGLLVASSEDPVAKKETGHDQAGQHLAMLNVMTRSVLDEMRQSIQAGDVPTVLCTPDSQIALSEWASGDGFVADIANARLALFGEFDVLDRAAALNLARIYLHYAMGYEAGEVLDMPEMRQEDTSVLRSIARILDNHDANHVTAFEGQEACQSDSALWALLDSRGEVTADETNRPAILQAFGRLPDPVQSAVKPALMQAFLEIEDVTSAEAVQRMGAQAPLEDVAGQSLVLVAFEEASGEEALAIELRNRIVQSNSDSSPAAVVQIVDRAWSLDLGLEPSQIELIQAFLFEHRGSEISADLQRALVRAYLLVGDFDAAFRELASPDGAFDTRAGLADFFQALSEKGSDLDTLAYSYQITPSQVQALRREVAQKLSERLLGLGFTDQAAKFANAAAQAVAADPLSDRATSDQLEPSDAVDTVGSSRPVADAQDVTLNRARDLLRESLQSREALSTLLSQTD